MWPRRWRHGILGLYKSKIFQLNISNLVLEKVKKFQSKQKSTFKVMSVLLPGGSVEPLSSTL